MIEPCITNDGLPFLFLDHAFVSALLFVWLFICLFVVANQFDLAEKNLSPSTFATNKMGTPSPA